jgi:hypothetical protein
VGGAFVAYIAAAFFLYVHSRLWIPIVLPVAGGLLVNHVCLVTYRVMFEQKDKRRIRSIFSKVVSHKIVTKLVTEENLSLGGERREITVLFADIRGFTSFTDLSQERVASYVRENNLSGPEAELCYDQTARETLATVNLYLEIIADGARPPTMPATRSPASAPPSTRNGPCTSSIRSARRRTTACSLKT